MTLLFLCKNITDWGSLLELLYTCMANAKANGLLYQMQLMSASIGLVLFSELGN